MTEYLRPSFSTATTTAPTKSRRYSQYSAFSENPSIEQDEPKSSFNPFKAIKKMVKSAFGSSSKKKPKRRSSMSGTALRRTDTAVSYQSMNSAYSYAPSVVDQLFLPRYITPVQSEPVSAPIGGGLSGSYSKPSFLLPTPTNSKNLSSPPVTPSITRSSGGGVVAGDKKEGENYFNLNENNHHTNSHDMNTAATSSVASPAASAEKKITTTITTNNNANISITVTGGDATSVEVASTIKPTVNVRESHLHVHKKNKRQDEEEDDEDESNMPTTKEEARDQETTESKKSQEIVNNGENQTVDTTANDGSNNTTAATTINGTSGVETNGATNGAANGVTNGTTNGTAKTSSTRPPITTSKTAPAAVTTVATSSDSDGEFLTDDEEEEEEERINPGYKEWKRIRKEWTQGSDEIVHKESALKDVPESMYPKIYQCLVQQARPLRQPLNLADALKVIKAGWVSDGQWEAAAAASRSAVAAVAAAQPKPTHRPVYGIKIT